MSKIKQQLEKEKQNNETNGQGDFQEKHNEDLSFMNIQINDASIQKVYLITSFYRIK